jgi:hypothetical protein
MKLIPHLPTLLPLLLATACTGPVALSESGDPDRGPIGKADIVGTCEDACDGPALVGNCWCDDLCEAYGDCCEDKADVCDAVSTFDSFETFRGGFCPPELDCTGKIELFSDGTLKVDLMGDPGGIVREAIVPADALADAIAVLTAPDLLVILDGADPACPAPTDIFESMTLFDGNGEHRTSTTFCDDPALRAARDVLNALKDKYIEFSSFESFRISRGGFCPPAVDCSSSIELLADGTLKVDRMDDLGGGIHTATVNDFDLHAAIKVLTDPGLVEILDAGSPPCTAPTDVFEGMTLVDGDGEHNVGVTFCHGPEIDAVRDTLDALSAKYL